MKTPRRIIVLFVVVIALMALGVAAAFNAFGQLEDARAARQKTSLVLSTADDLLSKLRDAETGQRGFALTGDEAFLQPYEAARGGIAADLKRLREITRDDSARAHLDLLPALIDGKLSHVAEVIALRRANDLSAVQTLVNSGRGKSLMDAIRAEFAAIDTIEGAALREREALTASKLQGVFAVLVAGSVLSLAFAFAFGLLMLRLSRQWSKDLVHLETRRLLDAQEDTNRRLQVVNADLQASEAKLAVTLNSIGDAVVTTDASACITRLNPLAAKLTGWAEADVLGRPLNEIFCIISQETRQPAVVSVAQTLADGTIHELANHTVLIARDGSECPIADSCAPIRNHEGHVVGAILVFRDVTHEQTTRRLLQEIQARSDFALKMSATGGWELNLVDNTSHQTIEHARIFGYDSTSVPWSYDIFLQHVQPEDRAEVDRVIQEGMAARAEWHLECRIRRADGKLRWIRVASEPLAGGAERSHRMSGIVQDITDRMQIEVDRAGFNLALEKTNLELERARSIAETANLAKSDFLSSMSHELRSPLNAILGFAQLMDSETPSASPSQKASIDQILHAGWYLLELINEILDLAAVESGKLSFSAEAVSLAEVLAECHTMIAPQAISRGITLVMPRFDTPCFVRADRTRLKQALVNLLSNAIKYNRAHGSVDVTYVNVAQDRIRINVRDSGAGLAPGKLAQLFQAFNRLGQEVGAEQGTGIGLVMSKRLVELMGGVIGAESTLGVGSVFWFELSAEVAPQFGHEHGDVPAPAAIELPRSVATRTLLYVEDNPANLALVEQLIARRPDLHLLTATDGKLGVQIARAHLPDVILMDINLPGISGVQAMRMLLEDPLTAHIPILALSANAMPDDIIKGLAAGFHGYLTKPIRVGPFMEALDGALAFARKPASKGRIESAPVVG